MKRLLFTIVLAMGFVAVFAGSGYDVTYNQPQNGVYELNFNLDDFSVSNIQIDGITYSDINFEGSIFTQLIGFAQLPYLNASLILESNKNVSLEIVEGKYTDFHLQHSLLPSRGVIYRDQDPSTIPYEVSSKSLKDEWYPQNLAQNTDPFILKDFRGTTVYVYPFRYNAVTQTLRVYENITVKLIENNTLASNPKLKSSNNILREMNGIYSSLFINYNQSKDDLTIGEYGDILVICTDRDEDAIQPYIDWKMEKGFNVSKEVVAAGTNVKNLIQDTYDVNNNLLYVQLVGDWADVKSDIISNNSAPTDPQLGCVVGSDNHPDICIGRFSANNAGHVTIQVNKTIAYEQTPDMNDWYTSALGIASNQGAGDDGEYDNDHIDVIYDDKLEPNTYDNFVTAYDPSANAQMVTNAVNDGVSVINYCGHGSENSWVSSGFNNSNVNQLTNANKYPFIFSVACVNGAFHGNSDCFAETWLKKENGGAVMAMMSTINQPWNPPMRGQDYFNDILTGGYDYSAHPGQGGINTTEGRTTLGAIIFNGLVLMTTESAGDLETANTCFGEELLRAENKGAVGYIGGSNNTQWDEDYWWGVGAEAVSANPTYVEGLVGAYDGTFHDLDVSIDDDWFITQGQMVQAGNLAVTEGGGNEFYYWEIYHLMGDPSLMIYYSQAPEISASYQGLMSPGSTTFSVITEPYAYVAISKDGVLHGAAIASPDAGVAEITMFDPIVVPGVADIIITAQNLQPYIGTVTVAAPEGAFVLLNECEIDDSQGNDNSMADFGEYIMLDVTLENLGTQSGTNLVATISTTDEYITIDNGTKNWPDIPGGSTSLELGAFAITVDDIIEDQHIASFDIDITDGTETSAVIKIDEVWLSEIIPDLAL